MAQMYEHRMGTALVMDIGQTRSMLKYYKRWRDASVHLKWLVCWVAVDITAYDWGNWSVNCILRIEQLELYSPQAEVARPALWRFLLNSKIHILHRPTAWIHTTNCKIVDRFERNDWVPRRRSDKLEIIDNRSLQHLNNLFYSRAVYIFAVSWKTPHVTVINVIQSKFPRCLSWSVFFNLSWESNAT